MQIARMIRSRRAAVATMVLVSLAVAGCTSGTGEKPKSAERIKSDPKERFTETAYGVKASPRVTDLKNVPKGGGREQVGRPYKVAGKWYYPKEQPGYVKVGNASWYGASFHGRLTANGEVYDMFGLSAAHPTFPLPSYARVTNLETGSNVVVRVNDRGPYVGDRMMDLSSKAAEMLGYKSDGVGKIKVEYVGKAPLEGDDTPMLMASFHPGNVAPSINDGLASGVLLAMNGPSPTQSYAYAKRLPPVQGLPGVQSPAPLSQTSRSEPTSIDAILNGEGASRPASVPLPTPRREFGGLVVASYAPSEQKTHRGASAALTALGRPVAAERSQRIAVGAVDAGALTAVRRIADRCGVLVAEADGRTTSYELQFGAGIDPDPILRDLWAAGAQDAFILRD